MRRSPDKSEFKRFIRKAAESGGLEFIIALTIVIIFIGLFISSDDGLSTIFDIKFFSAIVLATILQMVALLCKNRIMCWTEDDIKLSPNYMQLVKRYPGTESTSNKLGSPLFSHDNAEASQSNMAMLYSHHILEPAQQGKTVLPILEDAAIAGKTIQIVDHPDRQFELPAAIQSHFAELFKSHATSNIYNQLVIRVDEWGASTPYCNTFRISTSRSTYFDSLVTNRAMDFRWSNGMTIRDLYQYGPFPPTLTANSPLSNHLGFNGIIITSDGKIPFIKRSKSVSIGKDTYATSIGASMKVKYALDEYHRLTSEGIQRAIKHEIEDELKISQVDITNITIMTAYRDLVEGGKPQFAFVAHTSLTFAQVCDKFKNTVKHKKAAHWDKELKELEDGTYMLGIEFNDLREAAISPEAIGVQVNGKPQILRMMPSAVATVVFLINYIEDTQ